MFCHQYSALFYCPFVHCLFFLSYPSSVYGENNHKFHLDLDLNNSLKSATFVHYNEGMSENLVIMHT